MGADPQRISSNTAAGQHTAAAPKWRPPHHNNHHHIINTWVDAVLVVEDDVVALVVLDGKAGEPLLLDAADCQRVHFVPLHFGEYELDSVRLLEATNVVRGRAEHEFAGQVRRRLPPLRIALCVVQCRRLPADRGLLVEGVPSAEGRWRRRRMMSDQQGKHSVQKSAAAFRSAGARAESRGEPETTAPVGAAQRARSRIVWESLW